MGKLKSLKAVSANGSHALKPLLKQNIVSASSRKVLNTPSVLLLKTDSVSASGPILNQLLPRIHTMFLVSVQHQRLMKPEKIISLSTGNHQRKMVVHPLKVTGLKSKIQTTSDGERSNVPQLPNRQWPDVISDSLTSWKDSITDSVLVLLTQ